ncbi:hypothetical protein SASPL_133253 [Salvia splendens]|uniref:AD domain-containing protein n=1 Tax=Salvia splendens TaxID=180675 RepID=A0A8X8X562_SALSN|nr:hypothetical protein SASPL_133253 [Salvia splendens]
MEAQGPKRNIRLLKANYIKEFAFLGHGEDPLDVNKCFVDLNTLQSKEESAIRQAEAEAERIGVGVTPQAQSLFDALSKTLPVRWDKSTIVVMNEVRVSSPYLPESVTGGTPAANERVRKVVRIFQSPDDSKEFVFGNAFLVSLIPRLVPFRWSLRRRDCNLAMVVNEEISMNLVEVNSSFFEPNEER